MGKVKKHVAFYSQSGSEIFDIYEKIEVLPDVIVTNKKSWNDVEETTNSKLMKVAASKIVLLPEKPTPKDYERVLENATLITLHGFLKIVPKEICDKFTIYNGHPGDIVNFPELKGRDPQEKAFNLKLPFTGCVIHKVTPEVDDGPIVLASGKVNIYNMNIQAIMSKLHDASVNLWCEFLVQKLDLDIDPKLRTNRRNKKK